jgi:uncharacterized protein YjbJ (UPF0337 family)
MGSSMTPILAGWTAVVESWLRLRGQPHQAGRRETMVDFDDLRGKAEELLGDHGDKVEDGIDKLADLAGKKVGHQAQIDQAADKVKEFVDDQQARQRAKQGGRPRPRQGGGGPKPKAGAAAKPEQRRRPRPN